jgi:glycerophosphoryl diester phosphodiesterase
VRDVDDEAIARTVDAGHAAIKPLDPPLTADVIGRCRAAGLEVYPWTCNDPRRAADLAAWGAAGIITDLPDVLLAARDARRRERV